ncbi:MAG TPA: GNAT family N-acetyltransferase [Candidatus Obscuribacterales bacterium]
MFVSSPQTNHAPPAIAHLPTARGRNQRQPTLTLRHAETTDGEALHAIFHHPDVLYWTVDLPFAPTTATPQQLLHDPDHNYVLVACDGPILVGALRLSLYPVARMRHLGRIGPVAVHPDHHGKGAGSALVAAAIDLADNWLNLHRLQLLVFADNQAAIALYQKYGFGVEGTLTDLVFRAGRYVDAIAMARLKPAG